MKNITLCLLFSIVAIASFAQTSKPKASAKKPAAATKAAPAQLKTPLDSFSYAVGLSMAGFYKEQGVRNINTALIMKALNDVKNGKPALDESQTNSCIVTYMTSMKSEKAAGNKTEGKAFLDSNKSKPGVTTLPSGLQYMVIKEGTGPKPALTDKVKVHYEGSLLNGKIFDSSIQRGEPIELNVNGVIAGWTEALQLMPVGSKWKLFIPSDLAYGDNGAGADIKPGATLLFDVELLEIVK
ncbi:MAG: FKBP-type peptidyl-prolyl cis-trans isomerase [Chitinophagaceae bacterium]|nr:FKBP-type peptidyl-prolyl cis-trans isomerase [Chitinophagaceae bacterium]